MVTFMVHNFDHSTKPQITAIWVKKNVYVYLAALVGVPCPLKITLQCSADKKFWEALA